MSRTRSTEDQQARAKQIEDLQTAQTKFWVKFSAVCAGVLIAMMALWGPVMKPWTQEREGLANLRKAQFDNKIQAEQSAAERDAAKLRAEAISIVGSVAKAFPEYRAQEFIGGFADALKAGEVKQTFYIPTQASVPVLPAMANPVSTLLPEVAPAPSEQAALD
jgi:hypothetical protein|tara:strand:+ start:520 stop:1008 length:489 start_codon:yes stop_codon:yes gene_type:complete